MKQPERCGKLTQILINNARFLKQQGYITKTDLDNCKNNADFYKLLSIKQKEYLERVYGIHGQV